MSGPATRIQLAPHADLKQRSGVDVLVLPELALRIGGSGGEILRACRAPVRVDEVVSRLRERHPGTEGLDREVHAFLERMRELGGVVRAWSAEGAGNERDEDEKGNGKGNGEDAARRAARLTAAAGDAPAPLNLIAELTYRCPLRCPYCSNPIDLRAHREALAAEDWCRVFREAAALGVVHVGLTGGEPSARADLERIVEGAVEADLYPHLVTAGLPLDGDRLEGLARRGLRSVQISIQDATAEASDRIAGSESFERKLALCERTRALGLALTLNCVLHRHNLDSVPALIELARRVDADRLELANTQYHGWALRNREALMPRPEQLEAGRAAARRAQQEAARPTILYVLPDYHAGRPKPCMGGWGRLAMVVDPTGRLLPCHDAGQIPGLEFWNVRERPVAECWSEAPGMNAYRGTDWMPGPCASCPERERDLGGCRCQAFQLLGDAGLTDPACSLSPHHDRVVRARQSPDESGISTPSRSDPPWAYRGAPGPSARSPRDVASSRGRSRPRS